jgi:hypothetical protein
MEHGHRGRLGANVQSRVILGNDVELETVVTQNQNMVAKIVMERGLERNIA